MSNTPFSCPLLSLTSSCFFSITRENDVISGQRYWSLYKESSRMPMFMLEFCCNDLDESESLAPSLTCFAGNHLWVHLGGCFQKGLTEKGQLTLNVSFCIPWAGDQHWVKMSKGIWEPHPISLLPGCICNVTSCFTYLLSSLHALMAQTLKL